MGQGFFVFKQQNEQYRSIGTYPAAKSPLSHTQAGANLTTFTGESDPLKT
jgi:hypothetical protein